MNRTPVESSSLTSIGYDQESETLEVEFRKGRVYRYFAVKPELHAWLMKSPSKMGLLNRLVIGKFHEEEVVEEAEPQDLVALLSQSLKDPEKKP